MQIVDYETFIRMPAGTIFAPYKPCVFKSPFEIKTDSGWEYDNKWFFNGTMPLEPYFDGDCYPFECGEYDTSFDIYDGDSTDAKAHKMFAILEPHEIFNLINILYWALGKCIDDPVTYDRNFNIISNGED